MIVEQALKTSTSGKPASRHGAAGDQAAGQERPSGPARKAEMIPRLHAEEIVLASKHLAERDRALISAVFERGLPLKAVAIILNSPAGRLQRRLRRIVARLRSPLFRFVLRERGCWSAERRQLASAIALRGESQRRIAEQLGLSLHEVRMEVERLKTLANASEWGARD